MPVWVSLLRGVNLGAHNQIPMPSLRAALEDAGLREVRTYVQSGNVLSSSAHRNPAAVAGVFRSVIERTFGLQIPVIVRSPTQLRDVLAWNPFPDDAGQRPTAVHVVHLDANPEPARAAELRAADYGPDRLAIRGRDVVVCYAATMHRSRLQHAAILRRLGVDGTARNWRTLQALVDMTS